jgi:hypothetical protein
MQGLIEAQQWKVGEEVCQYHQESRVTGELVAKAADSGQRKQQVWVQVSPALRPTAVEGVGAGHLQDSGSALRQPSN